MTAIQYLLLFSLVSNNLTNYGRRHFKLFTNCYVSWDTLYYPFYLQQARLAPISILEVLSLLPPTSQFSSQLHTGGTIHPTSNMLVSSQFYTGGTIPPTTNKLVQLLATCWRYYPSYLQQTSLASSSILEATPLPLTSQVNFQPHTGGSIPPISNKLVQLQLNPKYYIHRKNL